MTILFSKALILALSILGNQHLTEAAQFNDLPTKIVRKITTEHGLSLPDHLALGAASSKVRRLNPSSQNLSPQEYLKWIKGQVALGCHQIGIFPFEKSERVGSIMKVPLIYQRSVDSLKNCFNVMFQSFKLFKPKTLQFSIPPFQMKTEIQTLWIEYAWLLQDLLKAMKEDTALANQITTIQFKSDAFSSQSNEILSLVADIAFSAPKLTATNLLESYQNQRDVNDILGNKILTIMNKRQIQNIDFKNEYIDLLHRNLVKYPFINFFHLANPENLATAKKTMNLLGNLNRPFTAYFNISQTYQQYLGIFSFENAKGIYLDLFDEILTSDITSMVLKRQTGIQNLDLKGPIRSSSNLRSVLATLLNMQKQRERPLKSFNCRIDPLTPSEEAIMARVVKEYSVLFRIETVGSKKFVKF